MKIFFLLFLTLLYNVLSAQSTKENVTPTFIITVTTYEFDSIALSGVTLRIEKGDSILHSMITSTNGKAQSLKLEYNSIYTILYIKEGYVSKSIIIDSKTDYYPEGVEDLTIFPAKVNMIKSLPNIDYNIISHKPVARIRIDTSTGGLDYDRLYISKRGEEISSFLETVKD